MREILLLIIFFTIVSVGWFLFTSGFANGCSNCDDGNPCTIEDCVDDRCIHEPVDGPVIGCYGVGGCIKYTCVEGSCVPRQVDDCCGNSVCEDFETYENCPRDCRASCSDSVQNQGESGTDCGGPCPACSDVFINYLNTLGSLRDDWYAVSLSYNEAIDKYNHDQDLDSLRSPTMNAYSRIVEIRYRLNNSMPPEALSGLKARFGSILDLYLESLNSMIIYSSSRNSTHLLLANRFMANSLANDTLFVRDFNAQAETQNRVFVDCHNGLLDEGEEFIDCGLACNKSCDSLVKVFKNLVIENARYTVEVEMNVTPPAIDYPPYQTILYTRTEPDPDAIVTGADGNTAYIYKMKFRGSGIRELRIEQLVELRNGMSPGRSTVSARSPSDLSLPKLESEAICPQARIIQSEASSVNQSMRYIYGWLNDNIDHSVDDLEHGGLYAYLKRQGACDEHADLSILFARCLDIPARRIVGYLVNSSELDGHAWLEYYDDGWVYLDPSVKGSLRGMVTDGRHLISCVGEKAYKCGLVYEYTFRKELQPNITIKEDVYLG
ncbi:transglutaminase family protein [Candidatus Altiarchaeota archaeon]